MKQWLKDNRGFVVFMLCLAFVRTAVADWNPIPSGSMRPTLLEGDVVLVNRLAYDAKLPLTDQVLVRLGEPRRGDVVTFHSPVDGTRLIKRIVGLPGDTVAMRDDVLFLNGRVVPHDAAEPVIEPVAPGLDLPALRGEEDLAGRAHGVQFIPGLGGRRSFAPQIVPADHFFVLGDNRNNSADSRFIGMVPREKLIGRAHRVLVSADILGHWLPRVERTVSEIR